MLVACRLALTPSPLSRLARNVLPLAAARALRPPPVRSWYNMPAALPPDDGKPIVGERRALITLGMVGRTFLIHSGREYKRVKVSAAMVGHKLGEFVLTRKARPKPKGKQTKKK
mmetsp:Transcript_11255/g.33363  ORF Transcript_11255/g.33363 Transcript_11255/m.33363 type:complete len:114 (+) Transcript_11255:15-356(+)